MNKERTLLWQVSVVVEGKRKYHQFTTLRKALRFMDHWIVDHIEETNTYPSHSLNLSIRQFKKAPKNIDQVL
jgi:hypothetical protein